MPVRSTRSGRVVRSSSDKQSKLDALELLARQRRGEKVDLGVKEDEPLFDEVDEEEYKRNRKGGFVVDAGSDDEYDSDDMDFIDDDDDIGEGESKRGKKRPKEKKSRAPEVDPRQKSMKSFLGGAGPSTSKAALPSFESGKKKPKVDEDDILSQMLFEVPSNRSSAITPKPKPSLSRLPTQSPVVQKSAQPSPKVSALSASQAMSSSRARRIKAEHDTPSKRQRISRSPPPASADDCFDDSMPELPSEVEPEDKSPSAIFKQMATQESISSAEHEENDESGIEAVPLDEDTKNNLEFLTNDDGKPYTRFYWLDCCEGQTPGTVYFFGRVNAITSKKYVSCCVIVKNVRRTVYLMISPNCTYDEAVGEFTHITAKKYQIRNFTCEKVTKKYSFSDDASIPLVSDYVKIVYPAGNNSLPAELKGETFCKVLNISQSPMEKLILELKLRGPCWMRLIEPVASTSPLTWTRIELVLESEQNLVVEPDASNLKAPYFCVLSLALQTHAHPTIAGRNDIVAISAMVNTTFYLDECLKRTNKASGHFVIMAKPSAAQKDPLRLPYDFDKQIKTFRRSRFELAESERDLLTNFMEKFSNLDPDIVVGHDLLNFDFETLVKQMVANKVGTWSKLGRFKRSTLVSTKKAFPYLFSGRVLCDIKKMAEELMQLRSYDLNELTSRILDRKRLDYDHASIVEAFRSSDGVIRMLSATWEDVDSIFSILVEMNIIPLALKITNITGNIFSRTLAAGRSERNEYLLLHAFHEENFICPEKRAPDWNKKGAGKSCRPTARGDEAAGEADEEGAEQQQQVVVGGRRKAAYTGGLVLEPKAGFYETCILLMDFNSLYPSIIQEFNICFSTVSVPSEGSDETAALVPSDSVATGVLPAQLRNLVDRRRRVKALMAQCKQPMQRTLLDIEQRALKLTANSMYGCLGFEYSRFCAKHLASLVTFKGREILMSTKALVESLGYDVIYGDTDSLMIDTKSGDYDEVMMKGQALKGDINRTFKLLEIDIDGLYRPLLLLKKKNYAGASVKKMPDGSLQTSIETKGLDSVRRDRAVVAKETGERVLSMLMESNGKDVCQIVEEIHAHLKELASSIGERRLANEKYLISKQLNKNPEEYRDTKGIGHVTIALRLNGDPRRAKKLRAGDVVDYVICLDGTKESANQRCYTLEEMLASGSEGQARLELDLEYYLCQQIYPAVARICDKLPFTNAYVIAEALGIESNSSLKIPRDSSEASKRDQLVSKGSARFNSCQPMEIHCPGCNNRELISQQIRKSPTSGKWEYSLASCTMCGFRMASRAKQVVVQVIGLIKRLTLGLYNSSFTCADCELTTRYVFGPMGDNDLLPLCHSCNSPMVAEMDDRRMDAQLNYYKFLLDIQNPSHEEANSRHLSEQATDELLDMYKRCHEQVLSALRMSFINTIDAQKVFNMVCSNR